MTVAARALLEQAKRLTPEERAELRAGLDALDGPQPPALTREERDRQIAESLAQLARGEVIDEADVMDELNAL
jgi:hypothetical protein